MTWQLSEIRRDDGSPLQLLTDDRFREQLPGDELPNLTCIRVWCVKPAVGYYWHPDESNEIDEVEDRLLKEVDAAGEGWVVYVHRRATPGCLEYFFYAGGEARLDGVAAAMQAAFPGRRFDATSSADSAWEQYLQWFDEATAGTANPGFTPDADRRLS